MKKVASLPHPVLLSKGISKHQHEEEIRYCSSPQYTFKQPISEPHGATRQQVIAKTPAK
jgi:hypothetical protein